MKSEIYLHFYPLTNTHTHLVLSRYKTCCIHLCCQCFKVLENAGPLINCLSLANVVPFGSWWSNCHFVQWFILNICFKRYWKVHWRLLGITHELLLKCYEWFLKGVVNAYDDPGPCQMKCSQVGCLFYLVQWKSYNVMFLCPFRT